MDYSIKFRVNVNSYIAVIRRFSIWLSRVVCWQSDSRAIVSSRVSFRCVRESPRWHAAAATGYRSPSEARHVLEMEAGYRSDSGRGLKCNATEQTPSALALKQNDRDRTTRSLSTKTGPRNARLYRIVARSFAIKVSILC